MNIRLLSISLLLTVIVGGIGIPMGDPKFIIPAFSLESVFVILFIISLKSNRIVYPSILVSIIVIIGNTISPRHIEIMSTFDPLGNAIVLLLGGYVLQGLILYSSIKYLFTQKFLHNSHN